MILMRKSSGKSHREQIMPDMEIQAGCWLLQMSAQSGPRKAKLKSQKRGSGIEACRWTYQERFSAEGC